MEQLYSKGKVVGQSETVEYKNVKCAIKFLPHIVELVEAALKDGVIITLASSLRTQDEQIALRRQNVIDKSKAGDMEVIMNAPSSQFYPVTGLPGWSNHQSGQATDFNVTGFPKAYVWLVENAHRFGWIRTVPSERWHWEYLPGLDQYAVVPAGHSSWDGIKPKQ